MKKKFLAAGLLCTFLALTLSGCKENKKSETKEVEKTAYEEVVEDVLTYSFNADGEAVTDTMFPEEYYEGLAAYYSEATGVEYSALAIKDMYIELFAEGDDEYTDLEIDFVDEKEADDDDVNDLDDTYNFREYGVEPEEAYIVSVKCKYKENGEAQSEAIRVFAYKYNDEWYAISVE